MTAFLADRAPKYINAARDFTFTVIWASFYFLDNNNCWVKSGSNVSMAANDVAGGLTNMRDCFNWVSLAAMLVYFVSMIGAFGVFSKEKKTRECAAKFDTVTYYVDYLLLLVVHLVRFSHGGKVCSGAYLTAEDGLDRKNYIMSVGNWMFVYIIITWVYIPILLLPTICSRGKKSGAFVMKNAY